MFRERAEQAGVPLASTGPMRDDGSFRAGLAKVMQEPNPLKSGALVFEVAARELEGRLQPVMEATADVDLIIHHAIDVAGFAAALDKRLEWEILNLGCGRPVTNLHFVKTLEGILGKKAVTENVPCPPTEPLITFADISKAKKLLGYEPRVNVEEGLARFVAWAREAGAIEFE